MSELRKRLDTGEWVIMAPERLEGKNIVKNPKKVKTLETSKVNKIKS